MPREQVLKILLDNKGNYISGEKISGDLGVSRAAICKDIKALKIDGYNISSVNNKGYMLVEETDTLNLVSIKNDVSNPLYTDNLLLFDTIDSTNTYAKKIAMDGAPHGSIVISKEQTAGRGRLGKSFKSAMNNGLYISIILRPNVVPLEAVNLTAYAAVAASNAVLKACGHRPEIKWINDLVMNKKKIAGILTEMAIEGESGLLDYIVLGIGINAYKNPNEFDSSLADIATSIEEACGIHISLNKLAACIINELDNMIKAWQDKSPEYHAIFKENCISLKAPLLVGKDKSPATPVDIDSDYGLIVKFSDGTIATQNSGEVSVVGYCGM